MPNQPASATSDNASPRFGRRIAWLVPIFAVLASMQVTALWRYSGQLVSGQRTVGFDAVLLLGAQLLALGAVLVTTWRLYLVARYRPVSGVSDAELPAVTVIVPAYNEGRQVYDTLCSLVASDYPAAKVQIVAIDDGSKDDTWDWIERARARFGRRITSVKFRANRGKRAGLYEGFSRATGEVVVTVDSDSEVLPDTLRNLVSPFVRDPRVGGVAGNVRVLNEGSLYGKMLDVSFNYSFEFMRASESMVDTVFCCPGALSAYRRELIDSFKDEWLAQTFLGRPANIGEDRALTNLVLRSGHLVRFQSNAIVLTEVPENLSQLSRMYLRWGRSNVRETLALGAFVFSRFRPESRLGTRINFVWSTLGLVMAALTFVPTVAMALSRPELLGVVVAGSLVAATLPAAIFAASRSSLRGVWAFPYAVFNAVCLSWITPWSMVTPHQSGWLTRTLPASTPTLATAPRLEEQEQKLAA